MAIRLTKETWDLIRAEYIAGATAQQLVDRHAFGLCAKSIHKRAHRENWRAGAGAPMSSQVAADRAQAEGITLDAAARLEAIGRNAVVASNRASATLIGKMMSEALHMASLASKDGNHSLAQSAQLLIAAAKEASVALKSKINTDRIAYDIAGSEKSTPVVTA
jgi:hypothetical protein